MSIDNLKKRKNSWANLPTILIARLSNAILSIRFVVSFSLGLLLIGGMGVWVPYIVKGDGNQAFFDSQSLFTYSMAILGTLLIEFSLDKDRTDDLGVLGIFVGFISLVLCLIGYFYIQNGFHEYTLLGTVFAIILYIFSTADNEKYDSTQDVSESTSTGFTDADIRKIQDKVESD